MIHGERERERESEREGERKESRCRKEESRVYPAKSQPRKFQNDLNSELALTKCVLMDFIDLPFQGF